MAPSSDEVETFPYFTTAGMSGAGSFSNRGANQNQPVHSGQNNNVENNVPGIPIRINKKAKKVPETHQEINRNFINKNKEKLLLPKYQEELYSQSEKPRGIPLVIEVYYYIVRFL